MVGWRYQRGPRPKLAIPTAEAEPPREVPAADPAPALLPSLNWTNSVRTAGACVCDVIYSECRCGRP